MANRTARDAATVKGTNPQYLVEKIIRTRIYDSVFWKEQCFGLSAETVVDKGAELRYIGGVFGGNNKPTPFLCLTLKLLQLQPDKDIIIEFIRQQDFKYLRALGAMYIRLTFSSVEVYKYLEPLFNDFRKLRYMDKMGKFSIVHMDEFIDYLLRETHYCDIQLPRLQKRQALEETDQLELYNSALDEDLDNLSSDSEDEVAKREKPRLISRRRSRSRIRKETAIVPVKGKGDLHLVGIVALIVTQRRAAVVGVRIGTTTRSEKSKNKMHCVPSLEWLHSKDEHQLFAL
ncbi:PRP38 family domain-containing protein [Ditylenchus destructor]|nr:PRP38 family domain-containing protein [Ditylenchus destructor]